MDSQNVGNPIKNPLGFTSDEASDEQVKHERVLEFIRRGDVRVISTTVDLNSYGRFMFVTLKITPTNGLRGNSFRQYPPLYFEFYGLGFHDYRDLYMVEKWNFFQSQAYLHVGSKGMDSERVLSEIITRHHEMSAHAIRYEQNKPGRKFAALADEVGDDAVILALEDDGLDLDD